MFSVDNYGRKLCNSDSQQNRTSRMLTLWTFFLFPLFADKDECQSNNGGCDIANGLCINTPGSYHCACKQGYELKENSEFLCEGKLQEVQIVKAASLKTVMDFRGLVWKRVWKMTFFVLINALLHNKTLGNSQIEKNHSIYSVSCLIN